MLLKGTERLFVNLFCKYVGKERTIALTAGAESRVPRAKSVSGMYVHAVSAATTATVSRPSRQVRSILREV